MPIRMQQTTAHHDMAETGTKIPISKTPQADKMDTMVHLVVEQDIISNEINVKRILAIFGEDAFFVWIFQSVCVVYYF